MTDYVKATDFASKDALLSGNPSKIIKGSEIDAEYNSIATAISTKADLASPTLTGTPLAPTATSGTDTTQIATTAFVKAAVDAAKAALYPVGSIYVNATSSTNPATLLGFGTWTAFGNGRVMVGLDSGNTAFDTAEETGGSADAIVVSHTHTATSTDSGHTHSVPSGGQTGTVGGNRYDNAANTNTSNLAAQTTGSSTANITTTVASTGSSGTNANLPPYIVVYMWKRTA